MATIWTTQTVDLKSMLVLSYREGHTWETRRKMFEAIEGESECLDCAISIVPDDYCKQWYGLYEGKATTGCSCIRCIVRQNKNNPDFTLKRIPRERCGFCLLLIVTDRQVSCVCGTSYHKCYVCGQMHTGDCTEAKFDFKYDMDLEIDFTNHMESICVRIEDYYAELRNSTGITVKARECDLYKKITVRELFGGVGRCHLMYPEVRLAYLEVMAFKKLYDHQKSLVVLNYWNLKLRDWAYAVHAVQNAQGMFEEEPYSFTWTDVLDFFKEDIFETCSELRVILTGCLSYITEALVTKTVSLSDLCGDRLLSIVSDIIKRKSGQILAILSVAVAVAVKSAIRVLMGYKPYQLIVEILMDGAIWHDVVMAITSDSTFYDELSDYVFGRKQQAQAGDDGFTLLASAIMTFVMMGKPQSTRIMRDLTSTWNFVRSMFQDDKGPASALRRTVNDWMGVSADQAMLDSYPYAKKLLEAVDNIEAAKFVHSTAIIVNIKAIWTKYIVEKRGWQEQHVLRMRHIMAHSESVGMAQNQKSATAAKGEMLTVALTGIGGSGKSTLIKVICNHFMDVLDRTTQDSEIYEGYWKFKQDLELVFGKSNFPTVMNDLIYSDIGQEHQDDYVHQWFYHLADFLNRKQTGEVSDGAKLNRLVDTTKQALRCAAIENKNMILTSFFGLIDANHPVTVWKNLMVNMNNGDAVITRVTENFEVTSKHEGTDNGSRHSSKPSIDLGSWSFQRKHIKTGADLGEPINLKKFLLIVMDIIKRSFYNVYFPKQDVNHQDITDYLQQTEGRADSREILVEDEEVDVQILGMQIQLDDNQFPNGFKTYTSDIDGFLSEEEVEKDSILQSFYDLGDKISSNVNRMSNFLKVETGVRLAQLSHRLKGVPLEFMHKKDTFDSYWKPCANLSKLPLDTLVVPGYIKYKQDDDELLDWFTVLYMMETFIFQTLSDNVETVSQMYSAYVQYEEVNKEKMKKLLKKTAVALLSGAPVPLKIKDAQVMCMMLTYILEEYADNFDKFNESIQLEYASRMFYWVRCKKLNLPCSLNTVVVSPVYQLLADYGNCIYLDSNPVNSSKFFLRRVTSDWKFWAMAAATAAGVLTLIYRFINKRNRIDNVKEIKRFEKFNSKQIQKHHELLISDIYDEATISGVKFVKMRTKTFAFYVPYDYVDIMKMKLEATVSVEQAALSVKQENMDVSLIHKKLQAGSQLNQRFEEQLNSLNGSIMMIGTLDSTFEHVQWWSNSFAINDTEVLIPAHVARKLKDGFVLQQLDLDKHQNSSLTVVPKNVDSMRYYSISVNVDQDVGLIKLWRQSLRMTGDHVSKFPMHATDVKSGKYTKKYIDVDSGELIEMRDIVGVPVDIANYVENDQNGNKVMITRHGNFLAMASPGLECSCMGIYLDQTTAAPNKIGGFHVAGCKIDSTATIITQQDLHKLQISCQQAEGLLERLPEELVAVGLAQKKEYLNKNSQFEANFLAENRSEDWPVEYGVARLAPFIKEGKKIRPVDLRLKKWAPVIAFSRDNYKPMDARTKDSVYSEIKALKLKHGHTDYVPDFDEALRSDADRKINSVHRNKSSGAILNAIYPSKWIMFDEKFVEPTLTLKGRDLLSRVENDYAEGNYFTSTQVGSLKDEKLLLEKVAGGNTRLFFVGDTVNFLLGRKVMHSVLTFFSRYGPEIGIMSNATPQSLGNYFKQFSQGVEIDIKSEEVGHNIGIWYEFIRFCIDTALWDNSGAKIKVDPNLMALNSINRVRYGVIMSAAKAMFQLEDCLFKSFGVLGSGFLLTFLINCFGNFISCHELKKHMSLKWAIFGDDAVLFPFTRKFLKEKVEMAWRVHGYWVTDGNKEQNFPVQDLVNLTFCGRKFHKHSVLGPIMRLTMERLRKSIQFWKGKERYGVFPDQMLNYIMELALYEKEDYDSAVQHLYYIDPTTKTDDKYHLQGIPSWLFAVKYFWTEDHKNDDGNWLVSFKMSVLKWMSNYEKMKNEVPSAQAGEDVIINNATADDNVTDMDQAVAGVINTDVEPNLAIVDTETESDYLMPIKEDMVVVGEMFKTPVVLHNGNWSAANTGSLWAGIFPGGYFDKFTDAQMKLANHLLMKCTMCIQVVINSSPTDIGTLILAGHHGGTRNMQDIYEATSVAHTIIKAGSNRPGIVKIKYARDVGYCVINQYKLANTSYEGQGRNFDFCRFQLRVMTLLGDTMSGSVPYTVCGWLEDVELAVPAYTDFVLSAQAKGQQSSNKVVISDKPTETQSQESDRFSGAKKFLRGVRGVMQEIGWVVKAGVTLGAEILPLIGLSKPTMSSKMDRIAPLSYGHIMHYDGPDPCWVAGISQGTGVILAPGAYGADDTQIVSIAKRWGLVKVFEITSANASGTNVGALLCRHDAYHNDLSFNRGPAYVYLANNFLYHRGDIEYVLVASKTITQTCTLEICVDYNSNIITTETAAAASQRLIWDMSETSVKGFIVKYTDPIAWRMAEPHEVVYTGGLVGFGPVVTLRVMNSLRSPSTVVDRLDLLVYARSPNMQVAYPYTTISVQGHVEAEVEKSDLKGKGIIIEDDYVQHAQMKNSSTSEQKPEANVYDCGDFMPDMFVRMGPRMRDVEPLVVSARTLGEEITDVMQVLKRYVRLVGTVVAANSYFEFSAHNWFAAHQFDKTLLALTRFFAFGSGGMRYIIILNSQASAEAELKFTMAGTGTVIQGREPNTRHYFGSQAAERWFPVEIPAFNPYGKFLMGNTKTQYMRGMLHNYETSSRNYQVFVALADDATMGGITFLPGFTFSGITAQKPEPALIV